MSLGRRKPERQAEFWVATNDLAGGPGHVFYDRLNQLLDEAGFCEVLQVSWTVQCLIFWGCVGFQIGLGKRIPAMMPEDVDDLGSQLPIHLISL